MKVFITNRAQIHICGSIILVLLACGCMPDAERDNPYDPHGQKAGETGQLTGRVTRIYPPFEGLAGVTVTLTAMDISDATDGGGYYILTNIPAGSYTVTVNTQDYASDSTEIEITAGQTQTADFALNGLPHILDSSITSEHSYTSSTEDQFYFNFEVQVDDPDGISDIDSVYVTVEALAFRQKLTRVINTNWYRVTISPESITGGSLEALIGQEAVFSVWDKIGKRTDSSPQFLVRIIYPSPSTVTPNEEEKMDDRQVLVWESFSDVVNFDFTFTVDVRTFSQGWQQKNIPSDSTSIVVTVRLDSQYPHQWSIWVVDEFGNTSKSPYVTFSIEGGN